jgi:hypothetical protein
MKLESTKDWPKIETKLLAQARALPAAQHDLEKICKNIQKTIGALSKEEINCRRLQHQTIKHAELVLEINNQIGFFEQLVTFAALLQNN